jgi:ABC-type Mn2+/Zn2+ transport system permease subunit
MFKRFTLTDKLLFAAALMSLVFSEVLYFQGNKQEATFIGIWVPSILAFGIYLKLINKSNKND